MTADDAESLDSLLRAVAAAPNVAPMPANDLLGGRFRLLRRLGAGGFGVVYEADDLRDGGRVALKLLRHSEASWLTRFKREFRALQGISHPHLVGLDELFAEAERWYFTMELIDGVDFTRHASTRSRDGSHEVPSDSTERAIQWTHAAPPASTSISEAARAAVFDESKLRAGLGQLMEGLSALHTAGKVHRDIKPSNVLVTSACRVVLIDFGLAVDARTTAESATMGTTGYMAPEQAAGRPVGPAADLYAVGVMLYEVLTGVLPIRGSGLQVLLDKQTLTPLPPSAIAAGVPADLERLCMRLLQIDPSQRPSTDEVRGLLAASPVRSDVVVAPRSHQAASFFGRSSELALLREAFEQSLHKGLTTVFVRGDSGIGKTQLVRHFMHLLRDSYPSAMLLEGGCHERETIPYNTLDGIVDMLSRRLARFSSSEVAALLPTRPALLARVFPALLRVAPVSRRSGEDEPATGAEGELRLRAFRELRELITRVALRHATVLFIDDLQWADADGLLALAQVLQSPDAPPVLFVGALRSETSAPFAHSALVQTLGLKDARTIELGVLEPLEASELAAALLGANWEPECPARIAREAGGHPLFVEELVRHMLPVTRQEVGLDEVIWSRVLGLAATDRELVELVVVAGAPLSQQTLARAAQLDASDFKRRAAVLRAGNLVRTHGAGWDDLIAPYHDRVREAVLARLAGPRRRYLHEVLAAALESDAQPDSQRLAFHWEQAGNAERAGRHAARAGSQAARALAFDRAALCFEQALALLPEADAERRTLHIQLANALAFVGRGALSATHFETAARESSPWEALELRRRAAEQLLTSGHFDRGVEASRVVLRAIGMRLPTTRVGTLLALVYFGLLLRVRGLRFRERAPAEIGVHKQTRIDTCFSLAAALGFAETMVGLVFQTRAMLLALASGDLHRVARSVSMQAAYSATTGRRSWPRTQKLLELARTLSERSGDAKIHAYVSGMTGIALFCNGRFREASEQSFQTLELLEDRSMGLVYESFTMRMCLIEQLAFQGRYRELCRVQGDGLKHATAQQHVYAAVHFRTGFASFAWLVRDRPSHAEQQIDEAMQRWSQRDFHLEHVRAMVGRIAVKLYMGDHEQAYAYAVQLLYDSKSSLLWRMQLVRFRALYFHGVATLALVGCGTHDDARLLKRVRRAASAIEREHTAWLLPFANVLRAGVRLREAGSKEAHLTLTEAARQFEAHDMAAYAAAARAHAALLRDDAESIAEAAQATAFLRDEGVISPERFLRTLVPVLPQERLHGLERDEPQMELEGGAPQTATGSGEFSPITRRRRSRSAPDRQST